MTIATATSPAATSPAATSPADHLARILAGLHAIVAAEGLRLGLGGALIILICTRLRRLGRRFATAATALRCAPSVRRERPRRGDSRRRAATLSLPRGTAWLLRCVPASAAAAGQLRHLLADPEMLDLIRARPATGRALRPLCHLLGISPPPALRLPPRPPAAPRAAEPTEPTPRTAVARAPKPKHARRAWLIAPPPPVFSRD